jgi:hypothetical protein
VSAGSWPGYRCCAVSPQPASQNWPSSGRPASGSAARAPGWCWPPWPGGCSPSAGPAGVGGAA